MKKVVLSLLLAVLILTGCGNKSSETVKCTMSQEMTGVKMNGDLTVKINDGKFSSIDLVIDAVIDDSYLSYRVNSNLLKQQMELNLLLKKQIKVLK